MMCIRNRRVAGLAAALAMAVGVGLGVGHWSGSVVGDEPRGSASVSTGAATRDDYRGSPTGVSFAKELSRSFRKAATEATPAVVKIQSHADAKQVSRRGNSGKRPVNPFKGTPFEDYFGDDLGGMQEFGGRVPERNGVGSGVIVDKSGLVLTNNHVVEGFDTVTIHLPDGREFKGTDIKTDPQSDLAVVHIKTSETLPVAKLGNSDDMDIGDWVIAVGNPFELETTVSAGIISGKGRELGLNRRAKFLQTDAAINPGNSGGPLVNLDGEVIGINTAIASSSGGYQGVGFAIPINQAKWVMTQLVDKGAVQRGYLGVAIGKMNPELAEKLGVKPDDGVAVMEVQPNSPAADLGIKPGDVISAFGNQKVKSPRELQEFVERSPVGSKQALTYVRDGKTQTATFTMKALPKDLAESGSANRGKSEEPSAGFTFDKMGFAVSDLSGSQRKAYKGIDGVIISRVDDDSPAAAAGLSEGVLIMEVNKHPVKDVASFETAAKSNAAKEGLLLLVRTPQGGQMLVVLRAS